MPQPTINTEIKSELGKIFSNYEEFKKTIEASLNDTDSLLNAKIDKLNLAMSESEKKIASLQKDFDAQNLKDARENIASGSKQESEYEKLFAQAVIDKALEKGNSKALIDINAAMQTQENNNGGFLVPPAIEQGILDLSRNENAMRLICSTVNLPKGDTISYIVNVGGASGNWVNETQTRPETNTPKLQKVDIPVHEISLEPRTTQTLLQDSALDLQSWLIEEAGYVKADLEGDAFINGNGSGKPRGILDYTTTANSAYVKSTDLSKIGYIAGGHASQINNSDNLIDLIHALKPKYRKNGLFLMNDQSLAALRKLKDGQGNYLWQPNFQADKVGLICGYGYVTDDNMPDIGANTFPIAFADFRRAYKIVDRRNMTLLVDPFTVRPQVIFAMSARVGGGLVQSEAIKLLKIGTA